MRVGSPEHPPLGLRRLGKGSSPRDPLPTKETPVWKSETRVFLALTPVHPGLRTGHDRTRTPDNRPELEKPQSPHRVQVDPRVSSTPPGTSDPPVPSSTSHPRRVVLPGKEEGRGRLPRVGLKVYVPPSH